MICKHCQTELDEHMLFCTKCGTAQKTNQNTLIVFDENEDIEKTVRLLAAPVIKRENKTNVDIENNNPDEFQLSESEQILHNTPANDAAHPFADKEPELTADNAEAMSEDAAPMRPECNISAFANETISTQSDYVPPIVPEITPLSDSAQDDNADNTDKKRADFPKAIILFFKRIFKSRSKAAKSSEKNDNSTTSLKSNAAPEVTFEDIHTAMLNHAPHDLNTAQAKAMLDSAVSRIIPSFHSAESLTGAILLCDVTTINKNIDSADTDTLLVALKAIIYYTSDSENAQILKNLQHSVICALKSRL